MSRKLLLIALLATSAWASTTYSLIGGTYSTITNYTSCSSGPCAAYTFALTISGSFTLPSALPANASGATDLSSQVTAYSFSDGVNTYTNTDPNARLYQFNVQTNSSGNITVASILVEKWQSGSSPHAAGNRVALLNLNGPTINQAVNNAPCLAVGAGTGSGVSDLCQTYNTDAATSTASANGPFSWSAGVTTGTPTPTPTPTSSVPALSQWAVIFLAGLLAFSACLVMRHRFTA